eukprot:PhF_6_TR7066/c1_g1_i2/m.10680
MMVTMMYLLPEVKLLHPRNMLIPLLVFELLPLKNPLSPLGNKMKEQMTRRMMRKKRRKTNKADKKIKNEKNEKKTTSNIKLQKSKKNCVQEKYAKQITKLN